MEYKGIKCPVCEKLFVENDDIVVCPKCGAPYHRDCYKNVGSCIFTDLHEQNKSWEAPITETPKTSDTVDTESSNICPRCGTKNAGNAIFCNNCGFYLSNESNFQNDSGHTANPYNSSNPFPGGQNNTGSDPENFKNYPPYPGGFQTGEMPVAFAIDPMGGYKKQEPVDSGVSAGDIYEIVKVNQPYYMTVFHNRQYYSKNRFNFSAFLFSGAWLLYRKINKLGIILTSIIAVLMIAETYLSYALISPMMASVFSTIGIDISSGATYSDIFKLAQYLIENDPSKLYIMYIPSIMGAIRLVIMIICGIKGNDWYFKHCKEKVLTIKTETASDEGLFHDRLYKDGGVNTAVAICLFICYSIITYIPQFFV